MTVFHQLWMFAMPLNQHVILLFRVIAIWATLAVVLQPLLSSLFFVLIMSFRNQGELIIANIGDTSGFVCCDVRFDRVLYCRNQESLLLSQWIIELVMIWRRNEFWRLEGELKINDFLDSQLFHGLLETVLIVPFFRQNRISTQFRSIMY